MGYRTGFLCHDSQELAADYFYSQQSIQNGSQTYTIFKKHNDKWIAQVYTSDAGQLFNEYPAPTLNFPECSAAESFMFGAVLAGKLFILFVIAYSFGLLARQFRV